MQEYLVDVSSSPFVSRQIRVLLYKSMKVWDQRSVYHKSAISLNLKKMASRPSRREHCFESLGGEWKNRDLRATSTSVQKMRSLPLIVRVARHFNRILRQNHPRSFKFRIEGKNFCTFIDHGGKIWQKVFLNINVTWCDFKRF